MLYSCTHMATVDVKGLILSDTDPSDVMSSDIVLTKAYNFGPKQNVFKPNPVPCLLLDLAS